MNIIKLIENLSNYDNKQDKCDCCKSDEWINNHRVHSKDCEIGNIVDYYNLMCTQNSTNELITVINDGCFTVGNYFDHEPPSIISSFKRKAIISDQLLPPIARAAWPKESHGPLGNFEIIVRFTPDCK